MRASPIIARVGRRSPAKPAGRAKRVRKMRGWSRKVAVGIVIATSRNDFNLAAFLGVSAPAKPYVVTINPDVVIGSTSTSTAAFSTGTLPVGSTLKIINRGRIQGKGGAGGNGGNAPANTTNGGDAGTSGAAGGPALDLGMNVSILNLGNIWGGGGGGGGGGSGGGLGSKGGGGGGGGGLGTQGGVGGVKGLGNGQDSIYDFGIGKDGGSGQDGHASNFGAGCFGGGPGFSNAPGGPGGDGGPPGTSGLSGSAGAGAGGGGGGSGAGGRAINLNGNEIVWIVGSGVPNVQETVS